MKKTLAILCCVAGLVVGSQAQTTITTGTNGITTTNVFTELGLSGAVTGLWNAIEASDILQATNWAAAPYVTYAPAAKDHIGGGVLAIYNVPQLSGTLGQVGMALGADWLGTWSLVSGNVTISVPTHPLAHAGILQGIIPDSITNTLCYPFALAGIGTPIGGSTQSAATIWDIGYQVRFGHWLGGQFGTGIAWGEWMNAGNESGHRYRLFLSYQKGF